MTHCMHMQDKFACIVLGPITVYVLRTIICVHYTPLLHWLEPLFAISALYLISDVHVNWDTGIATTYDVTLWIIPFIIYSLKFQLGFVSKIRSTTD